MTEKLTAEQIRKNRRIVAITACILAVAIPLLMLVYNQFLAPGPYELVCRDVNEHYPSHNPKRLIMEQEFGKGMTLVLYETHNKNVFGCQLVVKNLFTTEIKHWYQGGLLNPIFENQTDNAAMPHIRAQENANFYFLNDSLRLCIAVTGTSPERIFYGTEECEFIVDPETGSTFYWFTTEDNPIDIRTISFNEPSAYGIVKEEMVYAPGDASNEKGTLFAPDYLIHEKIIDQNHRFTFYKTKTGQYAGVVVNKAQNNMIQTGSGGIFHPGYIGKNIDGKSTYVRTVYPIGADQYLVAEITGKYPKSASLCDVPATVQYAGNFYLCYCLIPRSTYTSDTTFEYTYAS